MPEVSDTARPAADPGAKAGGAEAEIMLEMRGVGKWYGPYCALHDVNFRVRRGERVVICGPSGSGKSTLIRCVNQLEEHQAGQVLVGNVEVRAGMRNLEAVRRDVGMVFQQFNLFPHLTVMRNLTLGPMRNRNMGRAEAEDLALHFLGRVHMADYADKHPHQLSGGQQQRVAIARALCMRPKLMLFDEPTSALDPEMISGVLEVMMDLARDGMTMICVTHEMGFARTVADTMVFMDHGEIVEAEPPDTFFGAPRSDRVKLFLSQILSH